MEIKTAYNIWAEIYDTNKNRTRDLEANALQKVLQNLSFLNCLEIGCGTGKNTEWLVSKAENILAIDLSDQMLAKAKAKINSDKVVFLQADINEKWDFAGMAQFDLVTFSLVLEHIEDLDHIFQELSRAVKPNGHVYIGELHPFKQYGGSKARFETEEGLQVVTCYTHHISEFTGAAKKFGFAIEALDEFFDDNDKSQIPRILTLLLKKIG